MPVVHLPRPSVYGGKGKNFLSDLFSRKFHRQEIVHLFTAVLVTLTFSVDQLHKIRDDT